MLRSAGQEPTYEFYGRSIEFYGRSIEIKPITGDCPLTPADSAVAVGIVASAGDVTATIVKPGREAPGARPCRSQPLLDASTSASRRRRSFCVPATLEGAFHRTPVNRQRTSSRHLPVMVLCRMEG